MLVVVGLKVDKLLGWMGRRLVVVVTDGIIAASRVWGLRRALQERGL